LATASGSNTGSGVNYSWTPSSGLSQTTGSSVQASPTTTTTYTVTGTTVSSPGCSNTSQIVVTVDELVPGGIEIAENSTVIGATTTVCANASPTGKVIQTSTPIISGGTSPYT
jgi:hypothetical protein